MSDRLTINQHQITSNSEEQTLQMGRSLGEVLTIGDTVLLHGEMGAGKTCMARGVAQGADCEVSARSPTFIILAEYPGRVRIFHCDLYRITGAAETYELALEETLDRGALVVEWPENAAGELPEDALEVRIQIDQPSQQRTIAVNATGPTSQALLDRLTKALRMAEIT